MVRPDFSFRALSVCLMLCLAVSLPAVEDIEVLALFKDKAVVLVDGQRRFLRPGVVSPEGVLLISSDSQQAVLEIDGIRSVWHLGQRINSHFQAPAVLYTRIPLDSDGMYTTTGYINGLAVPFVIDTGASLVAMNSLQARQLGIDYRLTGQKARSETASGVVDVYVVELDRVRVGDIELRNVSGSVHEGSFPTVILLGMSFLGRLDMQRDGRVLELRKRP